MPGVGGNGTALKDDISDHTCAPWMILLVPFLAFGYILVRACVKFAGDKQGEKQKATELLKRDFLELFKVLALLGGFMCSTLLILFLMEIRTATSNGTMHKITIDEIRELEFGFIAAISLITVFTTIRAWQMRSEDSEDDEMLDENGYEPKNVFMDLSDRSMVAAITCCFGQNILFIYIMGGVWSKFDHFYDSASESSTIALVHSLANWKLPTFSTFTNSFMFLMTTAFVQHLIWDQMGDSFEDNIPYWKSLLNDCCGFHVEFYDADFLRHKKHKRWIRETIFSCFKKADHDELNNVEFRNRGQLQVYAEPEEGEWLILHPKVDRHELIVRMAMSWWINGAVRKLVVMLVPLMLMALEGSYLDFAQNATALTFIVQLDDPVSGRKFRIHKGTPSMRSPLLSC